MIYLYNNISQGSIKNCVDSLEDCLKLSKVMQSNIILAGNYKVSKIQSKLKKKYEQVLKKKYINAKIEVSYFKSW